MDPIRSSIDAAFASHPLNRDEWFETVSQFRMKVRRPKVRIVHAK